MSKERKILKKILVLYREDKSCMDWRTANEIQVLLDKPEHIVDVTDMVEPVAWMSLSDIEWMNIVNYPKILELTDGRHNSEEAVNLAVKVTEEKCKKNNSDSIPKRPPLTRQQISEGNQSMFNATRDAFVRGVIFAEKMHGIGGGE
jgi:hypothetical protein